MRRRRAHHQEAQLFAALFRFEQEFGDAFAAYGEHIAKAWSNATMLEQSLKQSVDRAWPKKVGDHDDDLRGADPALAVAPL